MKAPDKIYLSVIPESHGHYNDIYEEWSLSPINGAENVEYIRKDLVDEKIKTAEETIELAEDHAYFAGKEKLREELLEWAKEQKRLWEDRALDAIRSDTKYPIIVGTFGLKRDVFQIFIDKLNTI